MTVIYAIHRTTDDPKLRVGWGFDTARQTPDDPAWAEVASRHADALAAEAVDLRTRMAKGEGTPLHLVDFNKLMK